MLRSLKEQKRKERSERKRTRCPTLPIMDIFTPSRLFKNRRSPVGFSVYSTHTGEGVNILLHKVLCVDEDGKTIKFIYIPLHNKV